MMVKARLRKKAARRPGVFSWAWLWGLFMEALADFQVYRRPPNGLGANGEGSLELLGGVLDSGLRRLFVEGRLEFREEIGGRYVHQAAIRGGAVVPNPPDHSISAHQDEGVAWLAAGHRPLIGAIRCGDYAVFVIEVGARHAELRDSFGELGSGVDGDADEGDGESLELLRTFQVHDLLHSRRSTVGHIEIEEGVGIGEDIVEGEDRSVGGNEREPRG